MSAIVGKGIAAGGGGGELNIAYGLTPPSDTSKLWVRIADKPSEVTVKEATSFGKQVVSAYGFSTGPTTRQSLAFCNGYFYIKTHNTIYQYKDGEWVVAVNGTANNFKHYTAPAVVIGNKIFYLFGHSNDSYSVAAASPNSSTKNILVFDTETNTYTHVTVSGISDKCQLGNAVTIGTKIYFTAGQDNSNSTSAYADSSKIYEIDSENPSTATHVGDFFATSDMRGASVVAVGSVLYAKRVYFGSEGSIPYLHWIEYFDTETKINSRTQVKITKGGVRNCFMPGINVGGVIYWFGGLGRNYTPANLSYDGDNVDYAQRFNTVTGDFDFITVGSHVGNSHNSTLLSSTELVFARVGGVNNPAYKFTGAYELENGKLLIQESLFNNIWQAVKVKDGALSIGVNGVFLGGTDGYAQSKDAYLYDLTRQKWISLDGTPFGGGVTPEPTPTPILEGTWVLNERLYAPEKDFDEINLYFTFGTARCNRIRTSNLTHLSAYKVISGDGIDIYQFNSNTWKSTNRNLTFETGATASDEFRAWLASNATKQ